MNFSVKRVLKRRHNYLIPFLFIFCARCIYKSSYTPPSHPPKHIPLQGEPHRFANNLRRSDRAGQKNLCSSVKSVGQELVQNVKVCVNLTEQVKKICVICELKIGGRRESQICVTLLNPPPPRPQRNLCSSVKSVGHRCVKNRKYLGYFRYFPYICSV